MGCPQPPPRLNIRVIRDKGMNDGPGNSVVRSCGKATFKHAPSAGARQTSAIRTERYRSCWVRNFRPASEISQIPLGEPDFKSPSLTSVFRHHLAVFRQRGSCLCEGIG